MQKGVHLLGLQVQNLSKVEEYGYQVPHSTLEARDLELTDPDIKPKDRKSFGFKVGINSIPEIDSSLKAQTPTPELRMSMHLFVLLQCRGLNNLAAWDTFCDWWDNLVRIQPYSLCPCEAGCK